MLKFDNPEYIYALIIIPVIIILFLLTRRVRRKALNKFGESDIIKPLMPFSSKGRPIIKFVILITAFTFVVFALMNLQFGTKKEEIKREGVEIIIALDVSNSMMAEDIQPFRLERAKRAIDKLVERLHNDRIGLVVFAGDAYTQLPITTDYASAKMFLSIINTGIVPIQGTAIGKAIELASRSFTPENDKNRAIIVITDGENHEDDAVEQAKLAVEKGIVVHTIGMGKAKGAPIPVYSRYGQKSYRVDKDGNKVVTKLNEQMLQQIASAGNGVYIRANNANVGLNTLMSEIEKMEKEEFEAEIFSDFDDKYQWFLGFAFFLLFVEMIILERKNKFLINFRLFK